jgi:hypothetical protein
MKDKSIKKPTKKKKKTGITVMCRIKTFVSMN